MSDMPQESSWWQGPDGHWYPPEQVPLSDSSPLPPPPSFAPPPPPLQPAPAFVLTIGDIGVTSTQVVTPNGTAALAGSQWIVTDRTYTTTKIPTWAIVMAVLFALVCLLGLLFLLAKETVTTGYVEVTLHSESLVHMTQVPVTGPNDVAWYRQQVAHAQSLAAQA
jgi:hypothetical protein